MSPKEKGKFEDMAKQDKVRYEREMKNYVPPKGHKKKRFKDPNAPKRPPYVYIMTIKCVFATQQLHPSIKYLTCGPCRSAFFLFCAELRPKVKSESPGLTIGDTAKKLGEMWNSKTAEEKQPYEKKAAKLKEKYDKVITRRPNARKNNPFFFICTKKTPICHPQDIVAYRTKGKVDSESAATADDDEEEDDEEEEEDDDDEDDE